MNNKDKFLKNKKIIDWETKGNLVRFYLGDKEVENYWGDDWNDTPYEHNAEIVYDKFISGIVDVVFKFDYSIVLAENDYNYRGNSPYSKEDFKNRKAPFMMIVNNEDYIGFEPLYSQELDNEKAIKLFFNDDIRLVLKTLKHTIFNDINYERYEKNEN